MLLEDMVLPYYTCIPTQFSPDNPFSSFLGILGICLTRSCLNLVVSRGEKIILVFKDVSMYNPKQVEGQEVLRLLGELFEEGCYVPRGFK